VTKSEAGFLEDRIKRLEEGMVIAIQELGKVTFPGAVDPQVTARLKEILGGNRG
jgi:hypothetical protein